MPRKKMTPAAGVQENPAPKKRKPIIAVTEEEYDAHYEELKDMDNILLFVDEADRARWMQVQWPMDDRPDRED